MFHLMLHNVTRIRDPAGRSACAPVACLSVLLDSLYGARELPSKNAEGSSGKRSKPFGEQTVAVHPLIQVEAAC